MIEISVMTKQDIDFVISMTDLENWGYLPEDFHRLIAIEPQGCFVARDEGTNAGIVTSTSYNDYGFIGSLIVKETFRGHGIGEMLIKKAIDHLQVREVKCIELDGVFPAVSLYRRLGFRDKYLSLRMRRMADKDKAPSKQKPISRTITEIAEFDLNATDLTREPVLNQYADDLDRILFVSGKKRINGYALVRPRSGETMAIGPLVANSDDVAENILSDILNIHGDKPLTIGVPAIRQDFADLLLSQNFVYTLPSVRMYLGRRRDHENYIYAIFSAEKG